MARPITAEFEAARNDPNREPFIGYILKTQFGSRLFSESRIPDEWAHGPRAYFDSAVKFSASNLFGGDDAPWIDVAARLLDTGTVRLDSVRNLVNVRESLGGRTSSRDNFTVILNNADGYFSQMAGEEPFLAGEGGLVLGFKDLTFREHIELVPLTTIVQTRFSGGRIQIKHRR